jgi:hypothetical protein
MINQELRDAFKYHRQSQMRILTNGSRLFHSTHSKTAGWAIAQARADVAQGVKRYPSDHYAPACKQSDGLVYVEAERVGLRHVGNVEAESYGGSDCWARRDSCGWYTEPGGETFKDGTGLCWGAVYQLPARDGVARFVAGYIMGGSDSDNPTLDLARIFEEKRDRYYGETSAREMQAAREAARYADDMAKRAGEDEREYQTAWRAGSIYNDCTQELESIRRSALELIRDTKQNCATLRQLPESIRHVIKGDLKAKMARRSKLFAKMEKLASGDYGELIFYPDKRLRGAFNDAAGATVLKG